MFKERDEKTEVKKEKLTVKETDKKTEKEIEKETKKAIVKKKKIEKDTKREIALQFFVIYGVPALGLSTSVVFGLLEGVNLTLLR